MARSHASLLPILRELLVSGACSLPPERELATQLGVARNTLRAALATLTKEGHLVRERKLGTRLRHPGRIAAAPGTVVYLGAPQEHFYRDLVMGLGAELTAHSRPFIALDLSTAAPAEVTRVVTEASAVVAGDRVLVGLAGLPPGMRCIHADLWPCARSDITRLGVDILRATRCATEHLIALGHQRIGFVGPYPDQAGEEPDLLQSSPHTEWSEGWRLSMQHHGLRGPNLGIHFEDSRNSRRILRFIAKYRLTAVVCDADFRARQVVEVAIAAGIRVPQDLSVSGLFHTPWATRGLRLTTVDLGGQAMGRLAAQAILQQWEPIALRMDPTLVPGQSTAKPSVAS